MDVWGATPKLKQHFVASSIAKTLIPGIQKHRFWPMVCRGMGVLGVFGIAGVKHPHPKYPKTPFLAYGVQWYGCLGRHNRTQTIFLAIV